MASLRECARSIREEAADGIAWIALWKEGRSWNVKAFWPEDFNYDTDVMEFDADDLQVIRQIMSADPEAILVNGYYTNIGCEEEGILPDLDVLIYALRWQYEDCHPLISEWTIKEVA